MYKTRLFLQSTRTTKALNSSQRHLKTDCRLECFVLGLAESRSFYLAYNSFARFIVDRRSIKGDSHDLN
jgi:hypothetical protein